LKLNRIFIQTIEDWSRTRPLSIIGPTGSGKTSTLVSFLRKNSISPLLVSLDSVAAYKDLDIGASKPAGADLADFNWTGLSFLEATEKVNANLLKQAVLPEINSQKPSASPPIFVGGTHFYERFVIEGAAPGEASDPDYLVELQQIGKEKAFVMLREKDPRWAEFLHANDEYRIFRYSDLVLRQGIDFDSLREGSQHPLFPELECLILNPDRDELIVKLKNRIDEMIEAGWIEETKALVAKYGADAYALQSVGYFEIVNFLRRGEQDFDQLKSEILIRHRQLAKRQRTWLRSLAKT
jgi:tRNA dimethylallyltransferase